MNHYELDEDRAFNWMTNEKQYIYDVEKVNQVDTVISNLLVPGT